MSAAVAVLAAADARNLISGIRGINNGYPVVQCSMSALVMENRTLCTPGSVDSIPSKGNSEDHISNSTWCARKAATVVANTATSSASRCCWRRRR